MDGHAPSRADASLTLMTQYFEDLDDGDAARHRAGDVVRANQETGEQIAGPAAVVAFVRDLHRRMGDLRTRTYVVGEDAAVTEGDCLPDAAGHGHAGDESRERLPYVVVDDLTAEGIAGARFSMTLTRLRPRT